MNRDALKKTIHSVEWIKYSYLLYFGIVVLIMYLRTTMVDLDSILPDNYLEKIRKIGVVIIAVKLMYDKSWSRKQLLTAFAILVAFYGSWLKYQDPNIIFYLLLILGAKDISFDLLCKIYLLIQIPAILVITYLAHVGIVEDIIYMYKGIAYHSYGSVWRTDYAAHFVFLACIVCYLSRKKIYYVESIACIPLVIFLYVKCYTKTSCICLLILAAGAALYKWYTTATKRSQLFFDKAQPFIKPIVFFFAVCIPIFAAVMILLSRFYNPDRAWMSLVNRFLNNRLKFGHQGFDNYNTKLFGQYIPERGLGAHPNTAIPYFYLDCSYVKILLISGLLVFLVIMFILTRFSIVSYRSKEWMSLLAITVIAISSISEHHLIHVAYSPFLITIFANEKYRNSGKTEMNKDTKLKVCLVGSSGGHLTHLYMLKPFWQNKERFWVTFDKIDATTLLKDERMYPCYYPTNRNIKNLINNTALAWKILRKERPDLIISTGAAVAVPFFYLGKLFGAKLVYIEVFDRIDASTMTGKLVYPISDKFIVQWEEMKKIYPKAINLGSIF